MTDRPDAFDQLNANEVIAQIKTFAAYSQADIFLDMLQTSHIEPEKTAALVMARDWLRWASE